MKIHLPFCLLVCCTCTIDMAMSAVAQSPIQKGNSSRLLVVNQGDATLSIVDPTAAKQVATVAEGESDMVAHEVAASPDGRLAYLPLYGNSGLGSPGTDGRLMLVIDIATRRVVGRLDFGHGVRPHSVIFDRSHKLLYVTTELDQTVTVIDPIKLKIVGTIPTNQEQSHMLAISHDGRLGYTANVKSGTVSVLDLANRRLVTTIPIAPQIQRISISNDDSRIFTSDQTEPRLAVIDTSTNKRCRWITLPSVGYGSASTMDGHSLLVTMPNIGELAVIDLNTLKLVRTIKIGERPQEVLVRPDGAFAYVSCFGDHQVAVVDLANWQVVGMIDVGPRADGMAWVANTR
jgi:DNA-binding beta-propeller fold protein YncE